MKRIKRIFILFAPFNLFNPFLNTNCRELPENYPKIVFGTGGRRLGVWAKRIQMLNTNCQKLPENYPKIILGAGGRRLGVWAKRPQMLNTNCHKFSRCGQDKDASKRHYLNNPTLSDNGAQCGDCDPPRKKACRRHATSRTIRRLRLSETLLEGTSPTPDCTSFVWGY